MEDSKTTHKLVKRVKDEKFSIDKLDSYTLVLQIGIRDFQVTVIDTSENRCLLLEDFVLAPVKSFEEQLELLKNVFEGHHILLAGFWKSVRISIKNQKFSHVPASLFVKDACLDYLSINCQVDQNKEEILYYKSNKSEAITVFAINKQLKAWLESLYPNAEVGFLHQSCSLIEGVLEYVKSHKNINMFLYVDRFKLHIVTVKGGSLQYYNQFSIKQFSDYIKYIMLIFQGLGYDQKQSHVVLWGYIGKQSPHYKEFYRYIKNLSFGDRPDYLRFSFMFDEVQDHHYFDLYNLYICD